MWIFIEIDKIKISDEKFDDIAVTSIWVKPNNPNIKMIEYTELNKHNITHFICWKIKNNIKSITNNTKILKIIISFLTKLITSLAIISTPPR